MPGAAKLRRLFPKPNLRPALIYPHRASLPEEIEPITGREWEMWATPTCPVCYCLQTMLGLLTALLRQSGGWPTLLKVFCLRHHY